MVTVTQGVETILWLLTCGQFKSFSPETKLICVVIFYDVLLVGVGITVFMLLPTAWVGFDFAEALYFCVNVGLGIGYGNVLIHHYQAKYFTIFYCLFGTSLFSASLVLLAENVVTRMRENARVGRDYTASFLIGCWLIWFFTGVLWTMLVEGWHFPEAAYFVMTAFNTSGMVVVSRTNFQLYMCVFYIIIGVPLNAATMSACMSIFFNGYRESRESQALAQQEGSSSPAPKDWAGFLQHELSTANIVRPEVFEAIKDRYAEELKQIKNASA